MLVGLGALMTVGSGGLLVAIPLLHRASLLAGSGPAVDAVVDLGLYLLVVVALVLVPAGMVGFHTLQTWYCGWVGRAGLCAVVAASMVVASGSAGYLWTKDTGYLGIVSPLGTSGLSVGFVLYGAATLQARVLPWWCGIAFMIALPAAIALLWIRPVLGLGEGASTTSILFGLTWLALGCMLWPRR